MYDLLAFIASVSFFIPPQQFLSVCFAIHKQRNAVHHKHLLKEIWIFNTANWNLSSGHLFHSGDITECFSSQLPICLLFFLLCCGYSHLWGGFLHLSLAIFGQVGQKNMSDYQSSEHYYIKYTKVHSVTS